MEKHRTKFGTWLMVFITRNNLNIAGAAHLLGLAPTTLASIVAGRHPIPVFLRENIIATFHDRLSEMDIIEMQRSIVDTESGAVIVSRNYKQYVSASTINGQEWTQRLVDIMLKAVNKMTEEESEDFYARLYGISERESTISTGIDPDIDIKKLKQDIRRRYKDPVKTEQIVNAIQEMRK